MNCTLYSRVNKAKHELCIVHCTARLTKQNMNWTVYRRIIKAKQLNSEQQGCQSKTWTVQCKVGFPKQNMNCTVYSRVNKKQNKNWTVYSKVKKAKHEQYSVQQGCQSKTWTIQCTAGLTKQNMNFLFFLVSWFIDWFVGFMIQYHFKTPLLSCS